MKKILMLILVCSCALLACNKEDDNPIYGTWETLNAVGFKWEYQFVPGGQHCRKLIEYFPETSFCYTYTVSGKRVTVNAPESEQWTLIFHSNDVADVTRVVNGQTDRFILLRK